MKRGFSLFEVILSSVLVGGAMVSAVYASAGAARSARIAREQRDAALLIEGIAGEIFALPYEDPEGGSGLGPDSGESVRADFDDVDDYDGLTETTPTDWAGSPVGVPEGWRRAVVVEYYTTLGTKPLVTDDTGLKRVAVKLTSPSGATHRAWFERGRCGAGDPAHPEDRTVVVGVGVRFGEAGGERLRIGLVPGAAESQP